MLYESSVAGCLAALYNYKVRKSLVSGHPVGLWMPLLLMINDDDDEDDDDDDDDDGGGGGGGSVGSGGSGGLQASSLRVNTLAVMMMIMRTEHLPTFQYI